VVSGEARGIFKRNPRNLQKKSKKSSKEIRKIFKRNPRNLREKSGWVGINFSGYLIPSFGWQLS
jgi:hypothetical protein